MKGPQEVLRQKEDELEKVQPIPRPKNARLGAGAGVASACVDVETTFE
jgi:hypothetical protein